MKVHTHTHTHTRALCARLCAGGQERKSDKNKSPRLFGGGISSRLRFVLDEDDLSQTGQKYIGAIYEMR